MSYKKYSCAIILTLILICSANAVIWNLLVSNVFTIIDGHGDLSRLCSTKLASVDNLNPVYSVRHKEFRDYLNNNSKEHFDIITLGSSCSNGGGGAYYQDYLTDKYSLKILNIPCRNSNPSEILAMLAVKGYIQNIKPRYVIVECVERNFPGITKWKPAALENKADKFITLSSTEKDKEDMGFFSPIRLKANINFFQNKLYARTHNDGLSDKVKITGITDELFNGLKTGKMLYYYADDMNYLKSEHDTEKINESLNMLSDFLAEYDIKLIFLAVPDKHSLYFPYIIDSRDILENPSYNKLKLARKNYSFIDVKGILRDVLNTELIQDLYWGDDTHWSYKAHKFVGDHIASLFSQLTR